MKYLSFALIPSLFSFGMAYGQVKDTLPAPYVDSGIVSWDFHSKIIDEEYTIYVNTPSGYDTTKTNYPVLYETDGDWNVITSIDCFSMLDQDYETVTPIIVGIGYGNRTNKRGRDLDPSTGGPKFLAFIEKEVMPFIKSKYRVNDHNALYGYSYGGLFTTSVLFGHPGLFETIFIGAPGMNGRDLIPQAQKYFAAHTDLNCKVFVGVGSFEHETVANVEKFQAYMAKQNCKSLDLKTVIIPGAAHGAGLGPVMQSGIKFAYCKTHKPIVLTEKELEKYTGNYSSVEFANIKFKIRLENGKLYFQQGGTQSLPVQFVPFAADCFFMVENEKAEACYKEEGGKKYFLFTTANEKPHRIDKVNGTR